MNMQTGFNGSGVADNYVNTMMDILLPILEQSMVLAGEYMRGCDRDTMLPEDLEYAIKYCAMHRVGQVIGSTMPEIYDEEESDEEEEESDEEGKLPDFVRYSGPDQGFIQVNEAFDRWDSWIPQSPTEQLLNNAINSNEHLRTWSMGVLR